MPRNPNQKAKLLYLLQILWQETDPEHRLTVPELLDKLQQKGITAERKSIYSDLALLEEEFDMDILPLARDRRGCALGSRIFELPEIGMLLDMVQSSRFLTHEKAAQLMDKLFTQVSAAQADQLRRQIYRTGMAPGAANEKIYYTLDQLNEAINGDCQITYQYLDWSLDGGRRPRHGGRRYRVSPWALVYQEENYYLVAYDANEGRLKHYRIDRIENAQMEPNCPREGREEFEAAHPQTYARRMFHMYGGREERVQLRCAAGLVNAVRDRFGPEAVIVPEPDHSAFTTQVLVSVSPQFYAWVFGFGDEMEILSPDAVREEYIRRLRAALKAHGE